jgi:hypothetical protein
VTSADVLFLSINGFANFGFDLVSNDAFVDVFPVLLSSEVRNMLIADLMSCYDR